ncbi:Gfo/Idh/MocA family oxidoreductase [Candidatus Woesearchaeota archaeon]|nr:Gfo/Idh/MocA family oxidoreductase [Candidatus Woesearchaeota archaeon]
MGMTLDLCVVGAGECYEKYFLPADRLLREHGIAAIRTVIDVKDPAGVRLPTGAAYLKRREPQQPLDQLLTGTKNDIVVLAHSNDFHTPDAEELVRHGYKVVVEKPYSVNLGELSRLQALVQSGNLGLIEYYLFGKTPQLHILSGTIPPDSFFLTTPGLLKGDVAELRQNAGRLQDIVGKVNYVQIQFLEGANDTGSLMHRHDSTSIASLGGGTISDDAIHCFAIVTSLEHVMGKITELNSVKAAVCQEHQQHFMGKGYKAVDVAETYASIRLSAGDVPISFTVGKYVLGWPNNGRNHRNLLIVGTNGKIDVDLSSCTMAVYEGDSVEPRWKVGVEREQFPRYYAVVRAAIEGFDGKFKSLTPTILEAQAHVLESVDVAKRQYGNMPAYPAGAEAHEIQ